MEEVVERENLQAALRRVRQNQGSPGIDGITTEDLLPHVRGHWPRLREERHAGTYQPAPVKRQEMPKKGGGVRTRDPNRAGAVHPAGGVAIPATEVRPHLFRAASDGYRPSRRAQQALAEAQRYVETGRRDVVDVDLEKFFDRLNHAVLMGRLAR